MEIVLYHQEKPGPPPTTGIDSFGHERDATRHITASISGGSLQRSAQCPHGLTESAANRTSRDGDDGTASSSTWCADKQQQVHTNTSPLSHNHVNHVHITHVQYFTGYKINYVSPPHSWGLNFPVQWRLLSRPWLQLITCQSTAL